MENCQSPVKRKVLRLPLRKGPIKNPDDDQLVFWALREQILQKISPKEAHLPPDRISVLTMSRLKTLYDASVQRFELREEMRMKEIRKGHPIGVILQNIFRENSHYSGPS